MGGKKKLTLKQSEKMQERQARKQSGTGRGGKSGEGAGAVEKKVGVVPPDLRSEKTVSEIKKLKVLTPYGVASRFALRMSVAKDILQELEQKGVIQYVSGSRNLKIYKPLD